MHTGLKHDNAEAIINCLSALLPRAISVLISHKVIFTWDHCAVLSSLLSALLDAKRFLRKPLTKKDAMFCEFILRGNSVFLIDVLLQMLSCEHQDAFVQAIFERVQSLTVRHFVHPQQAIRLLIFAKWCSVYKGTPALQFKDLLQNRINSVAVVEWITKRMPDVLCGEVPQTQNSGELLQSLYEKCSLEQLVDLLNWNYQIPGALAERRTPCTSSNENPEQLTRNKRDEHGILNFLKGKHSESPGKLSSTFPFVDPMDFDLVSFPPHWLPESLESFLGEMRAASETDPEALSTGTSANGNIANSVQQTKREFSALSPSRERRRKRSQSDSSLGCNSKSQKRVKSQLMTEVDWVTNVLPVARGNSSSLGKINKSSPEPFPVFDCDRSPCLKSPTLCMGTHLSPLPITCTFLGSPSTVTRQSDTAVELTMLRMELTDTSEADIYVQKSSNKSHSETTTPSVRLSAERLRIESPVNESRFVKSSTVTPSDKTEHNELKISPSDQSSISAIVLQNSSILTANPILERTSVTIEHLSELPTKSAESRRTEELKSPLVVRVLSPKTDAKALLESHATVLEPLSSPDGSSKGQVRRTRTRSQFRVNNTPPHEDKMNTSSWKSKSPERVLEIATETIPPTRPERSLTFDQDNLSLLLNTSVVDRPTVNEINHVVLEQLKFGPIDSSRKDTKSTNPGDTESSILVPTVAHKTPKVSQKERSSTGERPRQQRRLSPARSAPTLPIVLRSTTGNKQRNKDIGKSLTLSQSSGHQTVRNAENCSLIASPAHSSAVCFSIPTFGHNHASIGAAIDNFGSDLATPTKRVRNSCVRQSPDHPPVTEALSDTMEIYSVISPPSFGSPRDSDKAVSEASFSGSALVDEHSDAIPWTLRSSKKAGGTSTVFCKSCEENPKNKRIPTRKQMLNSPKRKSNSLRCVMTLLSEPLGDRTAVLSSVQSAHPSGVRNVTYEIEKLSGPKLYPEAVPITPKESGVGPSSKTGKIPDISEGQCPSLHGEQSGASSSSSEYIATNSLLVNRCTEKRHIFMSTPTPEKNLIGKGRLPEVPDSTPSQSIRIKSPDSGLSARSCTVTSQTAVSTLGAWPDDIMNAQEYNKPSTSGYTKAGTPVVAAGVSPVRSGTKTRRSMEKSVSGMGGDVTTHINDPHNKCEEIPTREPYSLRERRFAK